MIGSHPDETVSIFNKTLYDVIGQTMALIIRILSETGLVPLRVETVEPKLEDIFLEVIR